MLVKSRVGVLLLIVSAFFVVNAAAQITVAKPVKLSIIDVAGNLALSKPAFESFKATHPNLVSDIEYIQLTAPELPSKIKAQQMAGNLDTTLVLTGYDAMASGLDMDIYEQLMPKYATAFQNTIDNYLPGARAAYDLFKGYGITMVWCPGGPMFTYNPDKVPNPPRTAAELLAWAKANPGKFMYARPANSGPGRAFLMGLPYILGDKNPKDPMTWDKTWAYLKELDNYIDYYPTGTGITFKELGQGTRWILASHLGWDMQQRILATIPANFQGFFLDHTTWVNDAQFMAVPKGLDKEQARCNDRAHQMDHDAGPAGCHFRQWVLLPRSRHQGRHPRYGSCRQPGGCKRSDPSRLRSGDREIPLHDAARSRGHGQSHGLVGPARRRKDKEIIVRVPTAGRGPLRGRRLASG